MGPFFEIFWKRGSFEPWTGHKSRNTQNNPITLYISEISVKFCVDWYTIWGVLKMFEIFDFYRMTKTSGPPRGGQTSIFLAEIFCVWFLHDFDLKIIMPTQNSKIAQFCSALMDNKQSAVLLLQHKFSKNTDSYLSKRVFRVALAQQSLMLNLWEYQAFFWDK